jgi:hypothetical protein
VQIRKKERKMETGRPIAVSAMVFVDTTRQIAKRKSEFLCKLHLQCNWKTEGLNFKIIIE